MVQSSYGERRPRFSGRRPNDYGRRPSRFGGGSATHGRPPSRFSRPSGGGGRGGPRAKHLDVNLFVNKAVSVEETETKFIPSQSFASLPVHDQLKKNIITKGYVEPTPIQDRVIPHILRGQDVVGIANTGTGKTAAFLIPLIDKMIAKPRESVLIVVPTRELALQINQELKGFIPSLKIFSVCAVGGANIGPQISQLRYHNQFIIGTPGRLKDLIERGRLNLGATSTIVLDEADRMLDMGFINDMKFLMSKMSRERHTLFFSATLSPEIERLIKDFLREPVMVSVKTRDTSKNVDQDVIRLRSGEDKLEALHQLLLKPEFDKVIVFGRTKYGVEKLATNLAKRGFKASSLHGNKSHGQRQKALGLFKEGAIQVLVATDVAARGLDIAGVSHVINYDLPATYEDYVHRIGRTGRWGKRGKALTFIG